MLIIATPDDETVSQKFVFESVHSHATIFPVDDNHRLEKLEEYQTEKKIYTASDLSDIWPVKF